MEYYTIAVSAAFVITLVFLLIEVSHLLKNNKRLTAAESELQQIKEKKERREKYTPELKNLVEYIENWGHDEEARWAVFYAAVSPFNGGTDPNGVRYWVFPNKTVTLGNKNYDIDTFDINKNGKFTVSVSRWLDDGTHGGYGSHRYANFYGTVQLETETKDKK